MATAAMAPKRRTRPQPNLELAKARLRKGLSRGDLAYLAGVSKKQVGLIERGVVRDPYPSTAHSLARVLEVDVLALFPIEQRFRR